MRSRWANIGATREKRETKADPITPKARRAEGSLKRILEILNKNLDELGKKI